VGVYVLKLVTFLQGYSMIHIPPSASEGSFVGIELGLSKTTGGDGARRVANLLDASDMSNVVINLASQRVIFARSIPDSHKGV
jgi:hypothetical protein